MILKNEAKFVFLHLNDFGVLRKIKVESPPPGKAPNLISRETDIHSIPTSNGKLPTLSVFFFFQIKSYL